MRMHACEPDANDVRSTTNTETRVMRFRSGPAKAIGELSRELS